MRMQALFAILPGLAELDLFLVQPIRVDDANRAGSLLHNVSVIEKATFRSHGP